VKSHLVIWIRRYATWIAILCFLTAAFVALIVNSIAFPLLLVCVAMGFVIFRYWEAIISFDMWGFDEWVRTRMEAIGIHQWHSPYRAAELFCNPQVVKARNDAAAKMNSIILELVKDTSRNTAAPPVAAVKGFPDQETAMRSRSDLAGRHADYEAAQTKHEQNNVALSRDLCRQLVAGTLMAKGLPVKDDAPQSERIIPTSRWRILGLDISKAEAFGRGLHYVGIVIGKKPVRQQ